MHSITVNDWSNQNDGIPELINFKLQEQVDKVRRQLENRSPLELMNTQGDIENSVSDTPSSSFAGISPIKYIVSTSGNRESMINTLDARYWIEQTYKLSIDNIISEPGSKKMSISEWVSYVRNNMISLNEHDQMADRISCLATDVETNEGISIDEKSLATFIMFLSSNKIEKRPSIGLNSSGYIDALWRFSQDLLVEIIFLPGHESQIVTFSRDLEDPEVINKRVATLPIANIMDVISNRNLDSLFSYRKGNEVAHVA